MSLSQEHIGSKILAKIKIYILTRAELLFTLCYEIPCRFHREGEVNFDNSVQRRTINGHTVHDRGMQIQECLLIKVLHSMTYFQSHITPQEKRNQNG